MKLLKLSDLTHFWTNVRKHIPTKISDLTDDKGLLSSHEDINLEDLPNESPNIRFINNSPQITWNEHIYYDPMTTLISGPSYEFDDETSLTSKSKIGYTNSSNSQNTVEHIYGQTYDTTKSFFTMKYYYGSNEKNDEEDESCTINSSLVFTLNPNYSSAGADTYYDESNAYSDVSPNNTNYNLGLFRPFKEIRAKDFKIALDGYDVSLISAFGDIGTHVADTDIHVTTSDKSNWNGKANDNAVVHLTGNETITGAKTFSDSLRLTGYPSIRMYTADDVWDVQPTDTKQSDIRFTDKNSAIISYFTFQHRNDSTEPFRTCWRQRKMDGTTDYYGVCFNNIGDFYPENNGAINLGTSSKRWKSVYATNYYYGANNVEFSDKFVTTDANQTVSGVKTFSDDTYFKSLNFTNEVASTSSSSSSIMPIVTTITYSDSSPSVQARLNLRVTADGVKSLYPHENNAYSLGLASRSFSDFYSYHGCFRGQQQNDEYSTNARTNLTLLANRDTLGTSGCLVDTYRENTAQGTGRHILGVGIKENSVRYEGCRFSWIWDTNLNGYYFSFTPTLQGANQSKEHNLGLSTDQWSKVYGVKYYYGSSNVEFSDKFVTADTSQTITERKTFTKNVTIKNEDVTIGSTSGAGSKDLTFTDSADNSLAKITANKVSNGSSSIAFRVDTTDSNDANINTQFQFFIAKSGVKVINPTLDNDISLGRTSNRWKDTCTCLINGLEPSALSMPDKANGIDISSYITIGNTDDNYYTPSVNGWIWAKMLGNGLAIQQGDFGSYANYVADSTTGDKYVETCLLVTKNVQATIRCRGITSIVSAYFYPCLGNV